MAFANYFAKNLQSASSLLRGIDPEGFKDLLAKESVAIAFDKTAATTAEGRKTLDLLTRLLARLYPVLTYLGLDQTAKRASKDLESLAQAVNPNIEIKGSTEGLTRCIVVGVVSAKGLPETCKVLFTGSDNWLARLSVKKPVGSGSSPNPFGAGAAACFAVANVFRQTFAAQLPNPKADEDVTFSVLDMAVVKKGSRNPGWEVVDLSEVFLVGCGAIANGFLWALRDFSGKGTLHVLDDEVLDITNLQRYVMTLAKDEGAKTELAKAWLSCSGVRLEPHPQRWEEYISERGNWTFERLAVAVDTELARINIQASLPRIVHNSWTQLGHAGVSRHGFLGTDACMACLYMPTQAGLNFDQLVQRALRLPDPMLGEVRRRLDLGLPTELAFLQQIAGFGVIPMEQLQPFENKKLEELYYRGACGGEIVAVRDGETARQIEVPMAFQSALSGILLAADVYAEVAKLRERLPTRTQINLLTVLPQFSPSDRVSKSANSRCICADPDFIEAYDAKYPPPEATGQHERPVPKKKSSAGHPN